MECDFVQATIGFLSCGIGSPSFTFLGIPTGINLRHREVWKPIVDKIRRILAIWHNRFLSIGGRVVFLNSVLVNILIFFFSFYKTPKVSRFSVFWCYRIRLGKGNFIDFLLHLWFSSVPLRFLFPSVFLVSDHHSYKVGECGFWLFGRWIWDIEIRADLLSEEDFVLLSQLYAILQVVQLDLWRDDRFIWWRNNGGFSVSDSYCRMVVVESSGVVMEADKL
ncbi:hypothetical protein KIW84_032831 [Lathyrus oleraceus]|uniref:Uncharacterized protein n=1 Tax=Pisum sativum TaxID=3888 RepID=A0A9D4XZN5_PEA|nr:hypothetical protein KIW84_032831 [Pisum sativum]